MFPVWWYISNWHPSENAELVFYITIDSASEPCELSQIGRCVSNLGYQTGLWSWLRLSRWMWRWVRRWPFAKDLTSLRHNRVSCCRLRFVAQTSVCWWRSASVGIRMAPYHIYGIRQETGQTLFVAIDLSYGCRSYLMQPINYNTQSSVAPVWTQMPLAVYTNTHPWVQRFHYDIIITCFVFVVGCVIMVSLGTTTNIAVAISFRQISYTFQDCFIYLQSMLINPTEMYNGAATTQFWKIPRYLR